MSWRAAMTAFVPSGDVVGELVGRAGEVAGEVVGRATDLGHVSQEPLGGEMVKIASSFST